MNQDVQSEFLVEALKLSLMRFPTFNVKIKKGFFWFYLDRNKKQPIVKMENNYVLRSINLRQNRGFLFTLSYFENRINLEIFHSLSDGAGGMEFFKSITYNYLNLLNSGLINDGTVKALEELDDDVLIKEEISDSFVFNYKNDVDKYDSEKTAFRIDEKIYTSNWSDLIQAEMSSTELKKIAKQYDATITEYLGGIIHLAIYNLYYKKCKSTKPVKLFIPVNARKFFNSRSIRNFVLYVRTEADYSEDKIDLETCINYVKQTFKKELTKERLEQRIKSNVHLEKKIALRIVPLFLKNITVKIGYLFLGTNINTMLFSNLGVIKMPEGSSEFIHRFDFCLGSCTRTPISCAGVSYNDVFVLSFISKMKDNSLVSYIFKTIGKEGISIKVNTNIKGEV
ncbi:MAG: hypothetical protein ACRC5M_05055 [Anaeroplasmataceae bacterium]